MDTKFVVFQTGANVTLNGATGNSAEGLTTPLDTPLYMNTVSASTKDPVTIQYGVNARMGTQVPVENYRTELPNPAGVARNLVYSFAC